VDVSFFSPGSRFTFILQRQKAGSLAPKAWIKNYPNTRIGLYNIVAGCVLFGNLAFDYELVSWMKRNADELTS
jgi:hypothetical protein